MAQDKLLGHGDDNDGIDEYDNQLPTWWVALFVVCVLWAVGYGINWHFIAQTSQAQLYEAEMMAAAEKWPTKEVNVADITADEDTMAAGKKIFDTNCVACHGGKMEGGIGPNLVDDEWIHGGELADIIKTVTDGVPDKGMITWGPVLGPEKIAQVSAYIHEQGKK
jgi:cytochrome c oxidase cbb3-type subunit 3